MKPRPRMFIVAGPPGAGKSTTFAGRTLANRWFNADDRAAELNGGSYHGIPLEIRRQVNREFERFVVDNIEALRSFAIETTLRSGVTFEQARLARDRGFQVVMIYVAIGSFADHLERVVRRANAGGHSASERLLSGIYEKSMENLAFLLNGGDGGLEILRVYDNAQFDAGPTLLLEVNNGRRVRSVRVLPEWLRVIVG